MTLQFEVKLLKKHDVAYYYCNNCGLLQTETPYWLDDAYQNAIADSDTGILSRNLTISRKLSSLLFFCMDKSSAYADTAGGYGLLTRLMRDNGFDFYWHDDYCENLFAKGFEQANNTRKLAAVTAFEVLEHIHNPLQFIKDTLDKSGTSTLIFSTELFAGKPPSPSEWWYYTPETGQHITFYQKKTLEFIARELSLNLYTNNNIHVLTERNMNRLKFKAMTSRLSWPISFYTRFRMQSKTFTDHLLLSNDKP